MPVPAGSGEILFTAHKRIGRFTVIKAEFLTTAVGGATGSLTRRTAGILWNIRIALGTSTGFTLTMKDDTAEKFDADLVVASSGNKAPTDSGASRRVMLVTESIELTVSGGGNAKTGTIYLFIEEDMR